jgi:hypothetical protein
MEPQDAAAAPPEFPAGSPPPESTLCRRMGNISVVRTVGALPKAAGNGGKATSTSVKVS